MTGPNPDVQPMPSRGEAALDPLEALQTIRVVQDQVIADRLASLLSSAQGRSSAERVVEGIVLDTLGEKEELEAVIQEWTAKEEGGDAHAMAPTPRPNFRDLVQSLLEVKRSAARRYRHIARAASDPALRERLERLASLTAEHAAILLGVLGELDAEEGQESPGGARKA